MMIEVGSRRWFLRTGFGASASLALPWLAGQTAIAVDGNQRISTYSANRSHGSVILSWLSGGQSYLDIWDPKPDAPREIRRPFDTIETKLPGVRLCEHLPLQAALMDKLTMLRSIDCRSSNH